jgi:hypothetical protein
VDLLWDVLRELGMLKKEETETRRPPAAGAKQPAPRRADRLERQRRAIGEESPAKVARAIRRMIRKG